MHLLYEFSHCQDVTNLLLIEAQLTKSLYKIAANYTKQKDFVRQHDSLDNANVFLNHGNYLAYGLAATTLWVLGILSTKAGFFDGETYAISYIKEGYKTGFLVLDTHLDNWYYGNILFAGIGSFTIDPYTRAMWALPKDSTTSLEKQPTYSKKIDKKWHIKLRPQAS